MSSHLTVEAMLAISASTHARASALSRSKGLIAFWHERRFARAIQDLIASLEALPQSEAQRITGADRDALGARIDAVISDVERFVARHDGGNLQRIERNRRYVRDIYELRAAFESLARGVTADPHYEDVRWAMKVDPTNTSSKQRAPR